MIIIPELAATIDITLWALISTIIGSCLYLWWMLK